MTEFNREQMNIVIVGHVDHGKSTVIGRLLADTGSVPDGKIEQLRAECERNAKPFEYAFLLDALKDERSQGITIDAARVFFKTPRREYIIIDAPGHIEFLKNMVTGASRAECALLVIDAKEGIRENSRRHGYLLSMLGIKQIAVVVNKMDLVDYSETVFRQIETDFRAFLRQIHVEPKVFVPLAAFHGDNVATPSPKMPWHKGGTILDVLDNFTKESAPLDLPFRLPVQDVYKFTAEGDDRRIVVGTVDTGSYDVGDEIVFYPSGKRTKVKSIEGFNRDGRDTRNFGYATGFTTTEQIYVRRGEIAARTGELPPRVSTRMRVSLFWLGKQSLVKDKDYLLKVGTAKVPVRLEHIHRVIDASNLNATETKTHVDRHDVAELVLRTRKPVAFDRAADIAATSRFVLVDQYEIAGGGIIWDELPDTSTESKGPIFDQTSGWQRSTLPPAVRRERQSQRATLLLLTGYDYARTLTMAQALEHKLFGAGRQTYSLGVGAMLHGDDAATQWRRIAETAYLLLDAGLLVVLAAPQLSQQTIDGLKDTLESDSVEVVWVGDEVQREIVVSTRIPPEHPDEALEIVRGLLQAKGAVY